MEEGTTLKDELKDIKRILEEDKPPQKKFRLPFKARVGNSKLRKGYATIVVVEDNKNIDFIKEPIVDGTIKLTDTFHAITDSDVFLYKGKPIIFQAKRKLNPYNPLKGQHETYGQKYVMARMEGDKIIGKKSIGIGIGLGALIIVGIIVYAVMTGA